MKITRKQIRQLVEQSGARYDFGTPAGDSVTSLSLNKNELKALSGAITYQVLPEDLKYIQYQTRKSKGQPWLKLTDRDDHFGNMVTSLDQEFAAQFGTTVEKVLEVLINGGASKAKRARRRAPRSFSYYD
jgi:S-adenosylmethionine hydrolase